MAAAMMLLGTTEMLLETTATSVTDRASRAMVEDDFRCKFLFILIARNFQPAALFALNAFLFRRH
jgi:hypothetical protein